MTDALAPFHRFTRAWFATRFGAPTDVQTRAWPVIASGRHALVTAPTGSGKTLTAFLWALDAFVAGRYAPGATRVLYVSPLKALNNDIERNLLQPLEGLRATFAAAGATMPGVHVRVRSGDTSPGDRQRMLRRPPEILITTPESLQLLLTTARGRAALGGVETVIVDEIHSVVDNRRGTVLSASLERLGHIAGEFQRIALSATVNPLAEVAAFVAGFDGAGVPRPIAIVAGADRKQLEFHVRFPEAVRHAVAAGQKIWEPLTAEFKSIIAANTSTLFFVNGRRLAEKITLKINEAAPVPLAYAHHGSLAREIRAEVETRLKSGALRAIVATNSLEMGIDIGSLDQVVLIQSPPSIASALQRIGRAGHAVGDVSRGALFPTHAQDFVEAAALAGCIEARDLEPIAPIGKPLDVLAQIIVSMCATQTWRVDDVLTLLKQSHSYHSLSREEFDLVVEMLAGRYAGSRLRDLKPRIVYDRIERTVHAAKGAVYALYNSGGTIPDRGAYHLRHADTNALIGELDEEFVWEATVGQIFSFGTQSWQIRRITHNDVLVGPAPAGTTATPFWRAEPNDRSFHYSTRIGEFLEHADDLLARKAGDELIDELRMHRGFDAGAAAELVDYLHRQREHTGVALPHRRHLVVEYVRTGPGGYQGPDEEQLVLHTSWGGRVNRPFAVALAAAWQREYGYAPEVHVDDDAVAVQTRGEVDAARVIDLVRPGEVDALIRAALERSGFFGARFRECAGRSLLVTKARFNQRMPLWMHRLHAKKLLETVRQYPDFPVLIEAFRTCLVDEFDLPSLHRVLDEIGSGEIHVTTVSSSAPSPFAANIAWGQISRYMYADDSPDNDSPSALSEDLIRAAVADATLRPAVERDVVERFVAKRQRTAPGYEPLDAADLAEWAKERVLMTRVQWAAACRAAAVDDVPIRWFESGERAWVVHPESAYVVGREFFDSSDPRDADVGDPRDRVALVRDVLSFYGPLRRDEIAALLPLAPTALDPLLAELADDGALIAGRLIAGDEALQYCDADNLEVLIRMQRAARRHHLEPRALFDLPAFLAAWHRFGRDASDDTLTETLERLRGYAAEVDVWLNDLIEARVQITDRRQVDEALGTAGFAWIGQRRGVVTVMPPEDLVLLEPRDVGARDAVVGAFRDPTARYGFFQLVDTAGRAADAFSDELWHAAWSGAVSTESFNALRAGQLRDYSLGNFAPLPQAAQRHRSVARRQARSMSQGWPGNWFLLPNDGDADDDPLTALETAKDRVRVLVDRYGVVSREIANREGGVFRWAALFRALRVMELSGELVAGLFFHGLSGPQFAAPAAIRSITRGGAVESFWVNATDPVAPCGLGVEWPAPLPARRSGNFLAFHRGAIVLAVENNGRRLTFGADLDDAAFSAAVTLLAHVLGMRRKIAIDSIDGAAPQLSPYLMRLADVFDVARDHRGVELLLPARRIG